MRRPAAAALAAVAALLLFSNPAEAEARNCPQSVGAQAAIVIEVATGTVACERQADKRLSIGSTTKLMTALVTLENAKLSDTFAASDYRPLPIESQIRLNPGERMKVSDLLRGLLLESGNDAAVALAEGVSGTRKRFYREMNRRARQLGLTNTHFSNEIGLDQEGNYSSARDLVKLAAVLRENTFFTKIVDSPVGTLKTGDHPRTFRNRNRLVARYPWVNGVKTGHTRGAGYVLVGSGSRNGIQVISAVLGTPSEAARDHDTLELLKFAIPRFQRIRAVVEGKVITRVPIRDRQGATLSLAPDRTVRRIIPRGTRDEITTDVVAPDVVEGPIRSGQRLGRVEVRQQGKLVATVALVAKSAVAAPTPAVKAKSWAARPYVVVGVAVALVATVLLVTRRARTGRRRTNRREAPRAA
ncbi:D-alanyl-D-alanine carboxypeptidase [Solirubrobacter sp. CPCC 204708]|uniref:serine-type D-Ala-D-Ala carboxypeptidase n=1 Tax=Solirubrobacter deserti TaxID=2282478 RepID=A0ABT4RIM7_9ACTN|nr:D-alanyl-D-alanine carboxypeptidase family protein [Solirubrobacter deserti]MBE2320209.1 D-alanyl-D-alanine carboxypeptidase [Solirubrobacter deserti]MDA0138405.1 D-alanyl-D-alanine carboxypeptidase [Solirubrobacter deserti]